MIYLRQILKQPVFDKEGEQIGTISDLAIATGEVFPRVTSLAFVGPGKTPFMISWRKYVDQFTEDGITLGVEAHDIRFSYLQPDEVLIALAISALTNPLADMARAQLGTLRGCDAHFSVIISEEDIKLYKRLGIHVSCEPKYESKRLYHK